MRKMAAAFLFLNAFDEKNHNNRSMNQRMRIFHLYNIIRTLSHPLLINLICLSEYWGDRFLTFPVKGPIKVGIRFCGKLYKM